MKPTSRLILVGASALAALAGCASAPEAPSGGNANDNSTVTDPDLLALLEVEEQDHVLGEADAPNTVIQYGDFESTESGDFFRENRPAVISDLVESGRARLVFRHFPRAEDNPSARQAAIASECAVDFFECHDLLFGNQTALTRDDLVRYAGQVGLNTGTFGNCLDGGSKAPRIERDLDSAEQLGVTEDPTFFVNDRVLIGNRPVEDFEELMD